MSPNEMSDEEYGRAWAEMMGKRPLYLADMAGKYRWTFCGNYDHHKLSAILIAAMQGADVFLGETIAAFATESEAYAALGKAVRAVHAAVPRLEVESS